MAGCSAPTTQQVPTTDAPAVDVPPTEPTPEGTEQQPTEDTAPLAEGSTAKEANTETSTIRWNAKKVGGAHYGTVKLNNGTLNFDENNKLIGGTFTLDMNSITNDDLEGDTHDSLLKHLQSDDFFSVENHPTSTLTITQVTELDTDAYQVTADLTIKGITNPVTFVATVDEDMTFIAPITIDRTLWDIKFRSLKFFSDIADKAIDDNITYDVKLTIVK